MALLSLFFCLIISLCFFHVNAAGIGANYGLLGDNLPSPDKVVSLLESKNISYVRIFDPNPDVLLALKESRLELVLGTRNEDLQQLAASPLCATQWVETNIVPYVPGVKFRYITAGNEVIPGPFAQFVLPAMLNLDAALKRANLIIPVSTAISFNTIGQSFPPSSGMFSDQSVVFMKPIVNFLESNRYPILVNTYPYFAYASNPDKIHVTYALGYKWPGAFVQDGIRTYTNLFDAMVDTMYSALERVGVYNLKIVVSETGWPSSGGDFATIRAARAYVNNVIAHVSSGSGTPKRPGIPTETFVFAVFNENLKPAGTEQHFGLFYPTMFPVYPVGIPAAV